MAPEIVAKFYEAAVFALNDPAVKQNLDTFGSEPGGQKPAEFAAFVLREKEKWGAIVRDAKVKPD